MKDVTNQLMEHFLRFFLPLYFIVYFVVAFFWRSYLVWKKTGINPFVLGHSDNAHDFIGRIFKATFALVALVVFSYGLSGELYQYSVPIFWLEHLSLKVIGLLLLLGSLLWTVICQAQMGGSWRIGIDEKHKTSLVRSGVYRFSRNPIFLGMAATLLGLLLVIPNALTLLISVLGITLIQIQVRLEEEFLTKAHGKEYLSYCGDVRRWL